MTQEPATVTILGRVPLLWNADRYVHLEASESGGTLCGIRVGLRTATRAELARLDATCPTCLGYSTVPPIPAMGRTRARRL
jgi:hypothetical protein